MAATYDGLAVALFVWLVIAVTIARTPGLPRAEFQLATGAAIALAISVLCCAREAARFVQYEAEELVAVVVAKRQRE
jgi:hypothetical protein